jgi:hypothetical protein
MDNVPQQEIDGTVYVPFRITADAYGWTIQRERETGMIYLINPFNQAEAFTLLELLFITGGFVENGVTWIPYEFASMIFDPLYMMMQEFDVWTFELCEESRELALQDFHFLIHFILENTPWDSVMHRALELNFHETVAYYWSIIENMQPFSIFAPEEEIFTSFFPLQSGDTPQEAAANYLFAVLLYALAQDFMGIGHLMPRTLDLYTIQYTDYRRVHYQHTNNDISTLTLELSMGAFADPAAIRLYGEIEVDLYSDTLPIPIVHDNIETVLFDAINTAYLRIHSFGVNMEYDDAILLPFLQSITDFDHLIIDLRENGGGFLQYGINMLLRRLLNEPIEYDSFEFFTSGPAAYAKMNALLQDALLIDDVLYAAIMPAADFITQRNKTEFNAEDFLRLAYVLVTSQLITPAYDAVGFTGEIWILVDNESASMSAILAEIAVDTGFATVVGTNTSGIMGATHLYTVLPNTGIVWRADIGYKTDALGRSLEVYGITPHVVILPDMDALEAVLALIMGG